MFKIFRQICLIILLASTPLMAKQVALRTEFNEILWATAQNIHHYYIDKVSPDTLMSAGVRGMFRALDDHSDYTLDLGAPFPPQADSRIYNAQLKRNFPLFQRIARAIDDSALYTVRADTLVRFGIAGMLDALDPYSVFMEKRNLDNFNIHTKGHYGGLGFRIQQVYPDSAIAVWALLHENTPAARAGIKSGDLIVAIDDSTTKHMDVGDAADLMRGEPDTPVTLTLKRAGTPDVFKKVIIRKKVQMQSVSYQTLFPDSTGYIKLTGFQLKKSSKEVRQALLELKDQGMQRLIFDLRGNGGGYLQEAVKIADLFLPKDRVVVYTAGRAFQDTAWYKTEEDALIGDAPMIVLVDQGSASASEIVSGAIQDWDRGLILGMPTVGKGSVQQTISIADKAELKLTMAAYFTPSGRSIDKRMRKDSTLVGNLDKVYRTQTLGRIVHGGGGITPDIHMEGRESTSLYNQLRGWRTRDPKFFHFSRQQPAWYPDITPAFRADRKTLGKFRKFVQQKNFDYISEAEAHLEKLEEIAQKDDYKKIEKTVNKLKKDIDKIEEQHWKDNRELILWKLTYDLLEKSNGLKAAYAYDATVDPVLNRARSILTDPQAYEKWFLEAEIGLREKQSTEDRP